MVNKWVTNNIYTQYSGYLKTLFSQLCAYIIMNQNSFYPDVIEHKAMKVWADQSLL